jgi:hypothetical protein
MAANFIAGAKVNITTLSDSQEIRRILRNPKLNYCVYNSPALVPSLSQCSPMHTSRIFI